MDVIVGLMELSSGWNDGDSMLLESSVRVTTRLLVSSTVVKIVVDPSVKGTVCVVVS